MEQGSGFCVLVAIGEVERIVKARWIDALVVLQDRLKLVERFDGDSFSGCSIFVVLPERQDFRPRAVIQCASQM
ncbi:hypothetical protein D3C72_1458060 [compost metagenome]